MHFIAVVSTLAGLAALTAAAPAADAAAKCGPAANTPLRDGGFESGKTPPTSGPADSWTVKGFVGSSSYALIRPGSTQPGGGKYAFEARPRPGPYTNGASGLTLTQTLHTCPASNYSIRADYRFAEAVDGKCSIKIQYPYKDTVGSVTSGAPAGSWTTTGSTFQAVSSDSKLDIIFSCVGSARTNIDVDRVEVAYFPGNAF